MNNCYKSTHILNVLNQMLAYSDSTGVTDNPRKRNFDYTRRSFDISVGPPTSDAAVIPPGSSLTLFDGTEPTGLIAGTSQVSMSLLSAQNSVYALSATGGSQFRTARTISGLTTAAVTINNNALAVFNFASASLTGVVVGDIMRISGALLYDTGPFAFNPLNAGLWVVIGVTGSTISAIRLVGQPFSGAQETVNPGALAALIAIQDITYTAVAAGSAGNANTIAYTTGGTAGSEVVTVTGTAISVQIQSGVSTATQVLAAIDASSPALALISAAITGTPSNAQVAPVAPTNLTGGQNVQIQFYSAAGIQAGDKISISGVFSIVTQNVYVVQDANPTTITFVSTQPIPQEGPLTYFENAITAYTESKRLVALEVDQNAVVQYNGDTGMTNKITPIKPGTKDLVGWSNKFGDTWSCTVVNTSVNPLNLSFFLAE